MRSLAALVVVVPCLTILPGCVWANWSNPPKATRSVTQVVEHVPGAALTIDSRNGSVEVRVSDEHEDVLITARITCIGATDADAQRRVDQATLSVARDTARRLTIKPVFPDGAKGGDGASFVVHGPHAEQVTINTSNGSVVTSGTTGSLVVDTSNGPIDVRDHAGPIRIDTSNGPVTIAGATDLVEVDTSNGGITVELADDSAGPLRLDTSNGPILATVRGGFHGPVTMDTSNGPVAIHDSAGRVHEQTVTRDRAEILVGDFGPASRLKTSNGGITLRVER